MTDISVLLSKDPSQNLVKGVFGRFDGQKMHIDPLLQRIYLFSLQKEMDVNAEDIVGLEVPDVGSQDAGCGAIKANLVAMLQRHWTVLYDSRAPLAGALQGMVRAEQEQVNQHCQSIINELDVGAPTDAAVNLRAHLDRPEYINDDESEIVTIDARRMQQYVEAATLEPDGEASNASNHQGLDSVDMNAGYAYDANMRMHLPLYGDAEQRKLFVEQLLPSLIRSGLLESVPTRVTDYQQADRDDDLQRLHAV